MKAGIALGMLATRAVQRLAPPTDARITMLWTTDEETGSDTSRALIEAEARQSEAVLVLEPALAGGALKTARKGVGQYELTVHGVSAHAGVDPRKGVNAIRELALQILAVDAIRDLDRGISVNVGVVSGGTRSNVVPDLAPKRSPTPTPSTGGCALWSHRCRALASTSAAVSTARQWNDPRVWSGCLRPRAPAPPKSGSR
jgi:glutamate carboxypeptidase